MVDAHAGQISVNVFSKDRNLESPEIEIPSGLQLNVRTKMDGLDFLAKLSPDTIPVAFFDPQYRGVLDKLGYGNEGKQRGKGRFALSQMSETLIVEFVRRIAESLMPSGHLFLWMDKFHLCTGFSEWLAGTRLDVVDMVTWDKGRIGMGYRTRRTSEHLVVLQKKPNGQKEYGRFTISRTCGTRKSTERATPMRSLFCFRAS